MTAATPWVAYTRSGPSYQSSISPLDHATTDGRTTLCGIRELGGCDRKKVFSTESAFACKKCVRAVVDSRPGQGDKASHVETLTASQSVSGEPRLARSILEAFFVLAITPVLWAVAVMFSN